MTWQVSSEYLIMLNDIILMDLIKIVQKGRHEAYYCAGFKQNGWLNCVPNHVHVAAKNWSLGGFAKITKSDYLFRHVDLSVCLSVSPSVFPFLRLSASKEHLGSHWTDFHGFWYLIILKKSVLNIEVLLEYDEKKRAL
jgi:hypothetical protein